MYKQFTGPDIWETAMNLHEAETVELKKSTSELKEAMTSLVESSQKMTPNGFR